MLWRTVPKGLRDSGVVIGGNVGGTRGAPGGDGEGRQVSDYGRFAGRRAILEFYIL